MDDFEEQLEAAKMAEQHELALAHLYETYAKKLPDHKEFWEEIATEERSHAFLINTFRGLMEEQRMVYDKRPFQAERIKGSIESMAGVLNHVLRSEVDMAEALETAIEIEHNMLEQGIFRPRDEDSAELKRVLETLFKETQEHAAKLKKLKDSLEGG